jgi:hypothetical protein
LLSCTYRDRNAPKWKSIRYVCPNVSASAFLLFVEKENLRLFLPLSNKHFVAAIDRISLPRGKQTCKNDGLLAD